MYDRFNRNITYLRVSVTDRCNLRCEYCMPEEGVKLLAHRDILPYEEICRVIETGVRMGIEKVRITGGEPLVRKEIVSFIRMVAGISGIRDLSMTTNGILLEDFADRLADAGLHRINISLDTMDPDRYFHITRTGELKRALQGIQAAKRSGMSPIKINCVVQNSSGEEDAQAVAAYCKENGLEVRFIRRMNLVNGEFGIVENGTGGDCFECNRLRLTANGMIKPCLFSDLEYSVRELGPDEAIRRAVANKPACGTISNHGAFYKIGG